MKRRVLLAVAILLGVTGIGGIAMSLASGSGGSSSVSAETIASPAKAVATQNCVKDTREAKGCVRVALATPAATPTPRVIVRVNTVVKTVQVPVSVPVVRTVVQTVNRDVVRIQRVEVAAVSRGYAASASSALPNGYPPGGHREQNGYYDYPVNGHAITVGINPRALGQFIFPEGQKIGSKAIQDAAHWSIPDTTYGPKDRPIVVVKITAPQAARRTQLIVLTSGDPWPYTISVYPSDDAPLDGTRIAFVREITKAAPVRHIASIVGVAPTPMPLATLPPAAKPCVTHEPVGFFLRGTAQLRPTDVFTDGLNHTCMVMPSNPEQIGDHPVPFKIGNDGDEVINYHFRDEDSMLYVDGTPNALVLQDGSGKGSNRLYIVKDTNHPYLAPLPGTAVKKKHWPR
jgi:hypothetical protein